jgi:hypothetical protein
MFVACMLIASLDTKGLWINSLKYPAYNPRVRPISMVPGVRAFEDLEELKARVLEEQKKLVVEICAENRHLIDKITNQLNMERTKLNPDTKLIESLQDLRKLLQESLGTHAEMLRKYPELEKWIEKEQLILKLKGK